MGELKGTETERSMLDRLNVRYGRTYKNGDYTGREFSRAEKVPNVMGVGYSSRIADYLAVRFFRSRGIEHLPYREQQNAWEEMGKPGASTTLIGHEVKVSRSDWLSELRDPEKAEAWKQHCHGWYLVVSNPTIVREDELPSDWGLMVKHGRSVRAVIRAPRLLDPQPLTMDLTAALVRATMQTETRIADVERSVS